MVGENQGTVSGDLGRFLIPDESPLSNGEPAVITLAMEPRQDDHYLSAVTREELEGEGGAKDHHPMTGFEIPENLR